MKIGNKINDIRSQSLWNKIRIQLDVSLERVLCNKIISDESIYMSLLREFYGIRLNENRK